MQAPPRQTSPCVQALPSLQVLPSGFGGSEQIPVAGLHVPALWHWSEAVHTTGVPAWQAPFWHISAPLQALPSLQLVPLATGVCVQPPAALHPSVVHGLPSSQLVPEPGTQIPAWQVEADAQAVAGAHTVPSGTGELWQPVAGSHVSAVHGLVSLQTRGVPGWHTPPWQTSAPLHALASAQLVPSASGGFEQTPVAGLQVPSMWHRSCAVQTTGVPDMHAPF